VLAAGVGGVKIFAGDVGGTTTRLGVYEIADGTLRTFIEQRFVNAEATGLEEIVTELLRGRGHECRAACFGVAGPVTGRRVRTTNLPWIVDADILERATGISPVVLINDLEATAWGAIRLGDGEVCHLNPGSDDPCGNGAVIAAGTGLGEAGIYWDGGAMLPFACEGGHTDFSPTDEHGFLADRRARRRAAAVPSATARRSCELGTGAVGLRACKSLPLHAQTRGEDGARLVHRGGWCG